MNSLSQILDSFDSRHPQRTEVSIPPPRLNFCSQFAFSDWFYDSTLCGSFKKQNDVDICHHICFMFLRTVSATSRKSDVEVEGSLLFAVAILGSTNAHCTKTREGLFFTQRISVLVPIYFLSHVRVGSCLNIFSSIGNAVIRISKTSRLVSIGGSFPNHLDYSLLPE